jgi:hypothetical protein
LEKLENGELRKEGALVRVRSGEASEKLIMLRRSTRLRREYLYRKSLEGKERSLYEKKRKIKQALAGLAFFFFLFLQLCENSIVVSEGKLVYASLEILFFLF